MSRFGLVNEVSAQELADKGMDEVRSQYMSGLGLSEAGEVAGIDKIGLATRALEILEPDDDKVFATWMKWHELYEGKALGFRPNGLPKESEFHDFLKEKRIDQISIVPMMKMSGREGAEARMVPARVQHADAWAIFGNADETGSFLLHQTDSITDIGDAASSMMREGDLGRVLFVDQDCGFAGGETYADMVEALGTGLGSDLRAHDAVKATSEVLERLRFWVPDHEGKPIGMQPG